MYVLPSAKPNPLRSIGLSQNVCDGCVHTRTSKSNTIGLYVSGSVGVHIICSVPQASLSSTQNLQCLHVFMFFPFKNVLPPADGLSTHPRVSVPGLNLGNYKPHQHGAGGSSGPVAYARSSHTRRASLRRDHFFNLAAFVFASYSYSRCRCTRPEAFDALSLARPAGPR